MFSQDNRHALNIKEMGNIIQIKVIPNASKNEILGFEGDVLKIRVKGVPEKGKVNQELINFLSKEFKIPKTKIEILSGHTSRIKRLKFPKDLKIE